MAATSPQATSTTLQFALQLTVVLIFALLATNSSMLLIPLQVITGTTDHKQLVVTSVLAVTHQSGSLLAPHQLKNSISTLQR